MSISDPTLLVEEINKLAQRLIDGKVNFFEVMLAVHGQRQSTDAGIPHLSESPAIMEALEGLVAAMNISFRRDWTKQFLDVSGAIGSGLASGEFGPGFFRGIIRH